MTLLDRIAGRRVYFDSNVFIYVVEGSAVYESALRPVVRAVASGALTALTSELTLSEVLVHPLRDRDAERERSFLRVVRAHGGLAVEPVSRSVLIEAARLRAATTALKLPDAIHAATARLHGCAVLLTNDARVRAVPNLEVLQLSEVV
ncbi:MAG: PIN domain-containing protein [Bacteroidota bacterium]